MSGRLYVSIGGISDRTRADIVDLLGDLDRREVPASLLVAPRINWRDESALKRKYRLIEDPATQELLRERKQHGDALVLHGYDQASTRRRRAEFSGLAEREAILRLTGADRILQQTGLRTRVFAAPRWTASPGTITALGQLGFRLNLGYGQIDDLVRGTSARGRVLGIGDGFLGDPWWCRALIATATRSARRDDPEHPLRLAIDAKFLAVPTARNAFLASIDLALAHGCVPATYRWPKPLAVPRPAAA